MVRDARIANPRGGVWRSLLCFLAVLLPHSVARASEEAAPTPQVTRYMIVVTGGELLAGAYADGHTHFLTRTLRPLGLQCVGSMCVDDKQADVQEAVRFGLGKANLVIVTGGLGPTDNDITREALAGVTGIELAEHPDVLANLARRFGVSIEGLRSNLRRQTRVPVGGGYLKNTKGTAVGLIFNASERVVVALPGPPRELQAMVRDELAPYLAKRFGTRKPGCSVTLRFVGLGQSQIDQKLKEHVTMPAEIIVNSQFSGGRVDFTFSLPDDTPEDRERLSRLKQSIVKCLGQYIYADDDTTLEEHVVGLLRSRDATLALAEVGSGGALTAALSAVPESDEVLVGAYVAPTEAMLHDLLHARGDSTRLVDVLSNATRSQWVVLVGPVRQVEGQSRVVDVTLKHPGDRTERWSIPLGGSAEMARLSLTTQLLDQLRRSVKPL